MSRQYTTVQVTCPSDWTDVLIAELAGRGYDGFLETEPGFETYREAEAFDERVLREVLNKYQSQAAISYTLQTVEERNWNEEWEKNFESITVGDQCRVRATFHPADPSYPYEIIINPQMSFGTGHHATTYLMLQAQLRLDHTGKRVMDAGCGTGILSIMAEKRGAASVLAFDIDEWATNNARENIAHNGCSHIQLFRGTITGVTNESPFDLILANINRNVLLDEMPQYANHLAPGGQLLLSGFYEEDLPLVQEAIAASGLTEVRKDSRDRWVMMVVERG